MRAHTHNEYHKSVNRAVDYIHKHLHEPMDLRRIAQEAMISEFHFSRIFKAYIGESIGVYVTRLRMERTAHLLQISGQSLREIAESTGYQSQQSLSKAFKKHFGIAPSAFRHLNTYLSSNVPKPQRKSVVLHPKTLIVDTKHLIYIRIIATYGSTLEYKNTWRKLIAFAKTRQLIHEHTEYIGLSFDDPNITANDKCRFYACMSTDQPVKPEGDIGTYTIEQGRFAVFTHQGAYSGLNDLYQSIYTDWIPDNYNKIRNSQSFEKYLNSPDEVKEEDLLTEVCMPIV